MNSWTGGFCFCAIILELPEEALDGADVAHACSGQGWLEAIGQSKVMERGDGEGVRWNEMLEPGGRKEVAREGSRIVSGAASVPHELTNTG